MENWYFILVPLGLAATFLSIKFFKMEEDYKTKTIEIQQKIEELKKKNSLLQSKQDVETFHSKRMNLIMKQFLYLHDVIVKKHLR